MNQTKAKNNKIIFKKYMDKNQYTINNNIKKL
jgi:hypothetical protein